MAKKKPERPKPKSLRGLIRALPDRVKAALIHTLVGLAKAGDSRASTLYARYSGESGAFATAAPDICCFTFTFPPIYDDEEEQELEKAEADIARALHGAPDDEPDEDEYVPPDYDYKV